MTDAEKVKYVRELYGYTQKEFAEMIRTSKQTISNWENGKPVPENAMFGIGVLARDYARLADEGWSHEEIRAWHEEPNWDESENDNKTMFIREHHDDILREFFKHEGKTGFLRMYVDENYELAFDGIEFIEGNFDKDDFYPLPTNYDGSGPGEVVSCGYAYYRILWVSDKTMNSYRETVLLHKASPHDFNVSETSKGQ